MTTAERIVPMAEKAFSCHEITRSVICDEDPLFKWYKVQRPGTWVYGFYITLTPGWITLAGDCGYLALSRELDMIPWCRSVILNREDARQIDWRYVAEKTPQEIDTREYCTDAAAAALDLLLDDDTPIDYEERLGLYDMANEGEHMWPQVCEKLWDLGIEPDVTPQDYNPSLIWCVMGIRKFLSLLEETSTAEVVMHNQIE